jgi:hypothetical protein
MIAQKHFMVDIESLLFRGLEQIQDLDTTRFLLFLGMSGGLVNALSVIGMRILPSEPETEDTEAATENIVEHEHHHHECEHTVASSLLLEAGSVIRDADEETPLLVGGDSPPPYVDDRTTAAPSQDAFNSTSESSAYHQPYHIQVRSISGKEFFLDRDAQMFFVVMVCLAGTGLMIINSISAMVDAIAASEAVAGSLVKGSGQVRSFFNGGGSPVASIRATHVALISVSSYVGRILSGIGSDVAIHRHGALRIDVVPIAIACMAVAQLVAMVASLRWLYLCSILVGLAYGGFFGVAGIIVAELWGEETCGQNW